MRSKRRAITAWLAVCFLWLLACGLGMAALARYENLPGQDVASLARWPDVSELELDPRSQTLVMFVHPHCPCTRASLGELDRLVAQSQGRIRPWIVFYRPSNSDPGWERTDLWNAAVSIPGCRQVMDVDGHLAERFRATTSGHTLLFDGNGSLLFSGGITYARGHQGDNPGRSAIVAKTTEKSSDLHHTPVFGCPIKAPPVR